MNGIVRVFLYNEKGDNINAFLIDERIADHCEESYLSRVGVEFYVFEVYSVISFCFTVSFHISSA